MHAVSIRRTILASAVALAAVAAPVLAGQRPQPVNRAAVQPTEARQPDQTAPPSDERDASDTRERFKVILDRYPPSVARVLKIDPSLLSNQNYLASYPAVATFVAQHPEVAHNPQYFLEFVFMGRDYGSVPDKTVMAMNVWRDILGGLALLIAFVIVTGTLGWLIRGLMDYRRWHRLSKIQTDAHNKVLDRLVSNEDLLAYIHTPAGQRFLDSAPIDLDMGPRTVRPLARILWSIQAGVVLAAAGLGIVFVSQRVIDDMGQPLFAVGALTLSIGGGFLVSALVAFVLSRRMGLLGPAAPAGNPTPPA